jgi:lipoic acid synthetase
MKTAAPGSPRLPKPPWLRVRLGSGEGFHRMAGLVRAQGLHTVCEEALCPNRGECWEHGRATIMILGQTCTRSCAFCGVGDRRPPPCDPAEPARVAEAVAAMGLDEVVLTSVTRDDLPDGGAALWAETIRRVRQAAPRMMVEVLVPDFGGDPAALEAVLRERPAVFGHNLEVVPSLYPAARPEADYGRSLGVLRRAHDAGLIVKTSLMLGLGERTDEIAAVLRDARAAGVEILFLGQYLQPTPAHLAVREYVTPEVFAAHRRTALAMGFGVVVSAPLVRSSYHAAEQTDYVRRRLGVSEAGSSPHGERG